MMDLPVDCKGYYVRIMLPLPKIKRSLLVSFCPASE